MENTTGTDHYAVGAKIRLSEQVFVSKAFFCRNIKKISKDEFENVFCNNRSYEIYNSETVDEALAALEFKVVKALNVVAPMKRVQTTTPSGSRRSLDSRFSVEML